MKRRLALLLLFLTLPAFAYAAPNGSSLRHKGTAHDALFDIAFDGSFGIAVGSGGTVLTSEDSGLTWMQDTRPDTPLALLGVAVDGPRRFAVGQSGRIFRFESSSWRVLESGTEERLLQVGLGPNGLVVVVGGFGTILVSNDDGATWTAPRIDWSALLNDFLEPHLYAVHVSGNAILVAGEFGLILRSDDRGATWSVTHRGEESIFDVAFNGRGDGVAVGQNGMALATQDGGRTWRRLQTLSGTNLLGVWMSGQHVFTAGIRGAYASQDGGRHWTPVKRSDIETGWYQAVGASAARGKPVLVGHRGRILEMDE
ncbi:MAG: hypothetical protein KF895_01890 [Parvibaculum sp.]|nr:hypothetical protein [Parvibaculum sp.]